MNVCRMFMEGCPEIPTIFYSRKQETGLNRKINPLSPEAEMTDDKAVPGIEFAGRAIAVQLFLGRGR